MRSSDATASDATALAVSVWDIIAPLYEVIYLIQGALHTSNLSGFSTHFVMLLPCQIAAAARFLRPMSAQDGIDLTSDVSFEATDDLRFCHSFARTTAHILLAWLMVAEAHEDDAIECSVGLAVAPSIESMAVGSC